MMQILMPILSYGTWFATPENEWLGLFHKYIPGWAAVIDRKLLVDYYHGDSTLYTWAHIRVWLIPVLWWSAFIFALVLVMLCLNLLMRRQWTEHEKLSYPIIQLPLGMTESGSGNLFRRKLVWIGFSIAATIDIVNGLHFLYPVVPSLGGKLYNIAPLFPSTPLNAIGWTPIAIYPFVIGLGFLIPLALSFSCWFFYLFFKAERILGAVLGLRALPKFPYIDEQGAGAYIGLSVFALWIGRRHIRQVISGFLRGDQNDDGQRVSYRWAVMGLLLCSAFMLVFCLRTGMSFLVIILFFVIYFALSIAVTRLRAELGPPVHDFHFASPIEFLIDAYGGRRLGGRNLTMLSYLFFFNRAHRSHPMPNQLEAMKMAEMRRVPLHTLVRAMILASAFGIIASAWSYLHLAYKYGTFGDWWVGNYTFSRLQRWLTNPGQTNLAGIIARGVGTLFTLWLMFMRMRSIWWPIHPAGYAISGSWSMNSFWFSILISFVCKWVILRFGGLRTYRKGIPLFLGLVLGEFTVGSFWSIMGIAAGRPMYRFLY
jgi:hypothetical protein